LPYSIQMGLKIRCPMQRSDHIPYRTWNQHLNAHDHPTIIIKRKQDLSLSLSLSHTHTQPTWQCFLTKAADSRRKFGLDRNGNPNYGRRGCHLFFIEINKVTRAWLLDWRGCFGQGIKWDAPSSFGL
jgi:hypothetical protein